MCQKSRDSLEDFAIRNAINLTNLCVSENLASLKRLVRLDLSYTKQLDDTVIKAVAGEMRNLKKLCLRFLNLITHDSVNLVLEHLKLLEGLDLSGCFGVNLDLPMYKLREHQHLSTLLLEYLFVLPTHLYQLKLSRIHTVSLFCMLLNH